MFDIESLSMSLKVVPVRSSHLFVQLTGTKIAHVKTSMGTNIFNLHKLKSYMKKKKH
ncbi:hypothetical protein HanRHA438_Chr17g0823781 [Helianthus annuus]|nr:hypothetical protein HanIR_Chr17g0883551 [Helianthus annuus]KAJ0827270.1 hypothetical protein HanRHA438_Chr17g0823781 [Helianthus annuus]